MLSTYGCTLDQAVSPSLLTFVRIPGENKTKEENVIKSHVFTWILMPIAVICEADCL